MGNSARSGRAEHRRHTLAVHSKLPSASSTGSALSICRPNTRSTGLIAKFAVVGCVQKGPRHTADDSTDCLCIRLGLQTGTRKARAGVAERLTAQITVRSANAAIGAGVHAGPAGTRINLRNIASTETNP